MATVPLFVKLSVAQRRELRASLRRPPDVRTDKRMKLVELSARGYRVQHLSKRFDVHQQRVRALGAARANSRCTRRGGGADSI